MRGLIAFLGMFLWILAALPASARDKPILYFGQSVGPVPACTPLQLVKKGRAESPGYRESNPKSAGGPGSPKPTVLRDLNDRWLSIETTIERYKALDQYDDIVDCVTHVDEYAGRFLQEHLEMLERGELVAGMPAEFAFMTLGKPDFAHRPTVVSTLNPVTGKAETFLAHTWTDLGKRGMWASVFGVVTVAAVGVSGVSDSIGTQIDALNVAAVTSITGAALTASAIAHATVVSVEIDTDRQIRTITLGGL